MTWIVGANCFNGFVSVSDIQATITFPDKSKKYFNCVRKAHKIYDNLVVSFSGDIRSGLLIIDDLRALLESCLRQHEQIFDLDGQSDIIRNNLLVWYHRHNPSLSPALELMFQWASFDDEDGIYRPYCWKFTAPEFKRKTAAPLTTDQSGSGLDNSDLNSIVTFLGGNESSCFEKYRNIFGSLERSRLVWTVRKFGNLLLNEAKRVSCEGVSRSFIRFECTIRYDRLLQDERAHQILRETASELGMEFDSSNSTGELLNIARADFEKIDERINSLRSKHPDKLRNLLRIISETQRMMNYNAIRECPNIVETFHLHENENIGRENIKSKWDDFRAFLHGNGIDLWACSASA